MIKFKLGTISNKIMFLVSLLFSILLLLAAFYDSKIKAYYYGCWDCIEKINLVEGLSFLFFSFLFFSFLFLFQKNKEKFEKWKNFSLWYFFINALIIIFTPEYSGDAFVNVQRSSVAVLLTGLHFIISLTIFFYQAKKIKNTDKK